MMRRLKSDGVLAMMGATVGITLALLFALIVIDGWRLLRFKSGGDQRKLSVAAQPGVDAVLQIKVFRIWGYTRTAPRWEDFETERRAWSLAAPIAMVVFGAIAGWWIGVIIGRWARCRAARQML